jgi:hypothetical protein
MKFLTALLTIVSYFLGMWKERKLREQGRQDAHKEAADEVQRQIELAERAATADDPARTQRLRSRFDDAASD